MSNSKTPEGVQDGKPRSRILGRTCLLGVAAATLVAVSCTGVFAQDTTDPVSTPRESSAPITLESLEAAEAMAAEALSAEALPAMIGDKVTIGLEFETSRLFTDSNFIPPDTMGAVGPMHIVEMINGNFEIFDKFTGMSVETRTLDSFWTNRVGLPIINNGRFDPRVVFDPDSERWFALSIDGALNRGMPGEVSNNIYIGRSDTDDPTGDWDGVAFDADTVGNEEFHDYPTLAVDADGFYTCTQDFDDGGHESCYSIPKADLLLAAPSIANMTRFEDTPAGLFDPSGVRGSIQPALDFGLSDGRAALLGVRGGLLRRSNIFGSAGPGAFLGTEVTITGDPGHADPPAARQPHPVDPTVTIENVAPRFVANVFEQDNSLWAVHAVQGSFSNSALQWYEIDETTDTVIQDGLIEIEGRDFHAPSIAVNELGNVVIGYTCSGPTLSPSTCVSVGETSAGVTTFEPPAILFTGLGHYYRDFCVEPDTTCSERNRWGDYSATVVDPVDSCTFWTFQEYVAVSASGDVGPDDPDGTTRTPPTEGGNWGTRVAELIFNSCAGGDLKVVKDCKPDQPLLVGETAICTIFVENLGPGPALDVQLVDRYISDGTFNFGTITPAEACTATTNPQILAGEVTCDLGSVSPGETITIKIPVTATAPQDVNDNVLVSSSTEDPNLVNNQAADTVTFFEAADLRVLKDCKPDGDLLAGVTGNCTIIVDNLGPGTATNVVLTDTHVSNVAFGIDNVTGTGCSESAGVVTCNLGNMAAGASKTVVVDIAEDEPQDINDITTVTSDTPDPDHSNNDAADGLHIVGLANLSITKTDSPDPVTAGEQLTYTLTVTNAGPSTAMNVVVEDQVPAGVTIVSVVPAASCNTGVAGDPLSPTVCGVDVLASGDSMIVTVTATVLPDTTGILSNDASVSSATQDPDNSDNFVTASTTVQAVSGLVISKSDVPDPVLAGNELTYTVTVTNNGPSTATMVDIVDTLPAEVSFQSALVTEGTAICSEAANVVTCTDGDLDPGEMLTVVITVLVDPSTPDGTPITNNADVLEEGVVADSIGIDTLVNAEADLWIDKTGNFPTGNPSTTIIYFLLVSNIGGCSVDDGLVCGDGGPSDAQNVVVTDTLPGPFKKVEIVFLSENCEDDNGDHVVICTTVTLPFGESVVHEIHIQVKGKVEDLLNTASVSSDTTDPDGANNEDTLLMVVKGGSDRPGGPGGGRGKGPK